MSHLLKTNLEARSVALSTSATNLSLFAGDEVEAVGIYLNQRQSYENRVAPKQVIVLHVFQGAGEFEVTQDGQEPFRAQITRGDIFSLPADSSFKISNEAKSNFIASQLIVQR